MPDSSHSVEDSDVLLTCLVTYRLATHMISGHKMMDSMYELPTDLVHYIVCYVKLLCIVNEGLGASLDIHTAKVLLARVKRQPKEVHGCHFANLMLIIKAIAAITPTFKLLF